MRLFGECAGARASFARAAPRGTSPAWRPLDSMRCAVHAFGDGPGLYASASLASLSDGGCMLGPLESLVGRVCAAAVVALAIAACAEEKPANSLAPPHAGYGKLR